MSLKIYCSFDFCSRRDLSATLPSEKSHAYMLWWQSINIRGLLLLLLMKTYILELLNIEIIAVWDNDRSDENALEKSRKEFLHLTWQKE